MDGKHDDPSPGTRLALGSLRGALPLGAAAALALFVAGGLDVVHRHQRAAKEEHEAKPAAEARKTEPRFVVGVAATGTALLVRDVRTGADVGLPVAAPQGRRFHRVAAVKDGSYVVASYAAGKVAFHRLHLDADGRPKDLQELPKAAVAGASTAWSDLAVSPDGEHVAYVTYQGKRGSVTVVSAASGARKAWTTRAPGRLSALSWAGTTLSFVWSPVGASSEAGHQVRALDLRGAGGDLKVSKVALTLPKGASTAVLSRDGRGFIAGIARDSQLTLQTFTLTGRPGRVLWRQRVNGALTALHPAHTGKGVLASAGDLYTQDTRPIPGKDLADAAW
ncbi:hypothetical protein [Actinomadura chibensis]|uniref:WD40 repeat domain-containing protein n=1 Tax=Actinomadura chibensis TaxID=392828 RepID=A0A5D0NWK3_9ACTN|nr:hypothetical protein [Actinomadura chibensis]TYB48835.1 hypothetical protein FXF69_06680 [Actinomadura chibensis]